MTGEIVIAIAERAIFDHLIVLVHFLLLPCYWINCQYFPSNDTNSRTDIGIYSENCCSISWNCFFWSLDDFANDRICNGYI